MRILIITPFPPEGIGGAETFVKELIKEASKQNEVTLCTLKIRHGKAWQGTSLKNLVSVFPQLLLKTLNLLFSMQFDIIHAQGLISGLVAVLLKKMFRVKVFITLLALYDFDTQKGIINSMTAFILKNCDIIFVEGENGKKDISRFGVASKCRIFQHWCDPSVFAPPKERNHDKLRVLFIGRPIPEKGRHIIEDAQRKLARPDIEFTYVDSAPFEELPRYYQMADVVCVPSLYSEGYSRVVMEAACCGCAVITSNKGSLPEMVKAFGWSCAPEDFATHIAALARDNYLEDLQKRAATYSKYNFSQKNAEVFLNEYHN